MAAITRSPFRKSRNHRKKSMRTFSAASAASFHSTADGEEATARQSRRTRARDLERREGLLSGERLHERRSDRVLRRDRGCDSTALARSPAYAQALSGRNKRRAFLREERAEV